MTKAFGSESTTDQVLEGVESQRQTHPGHRRLRRSRRRDGADLGGAWRAGGGRGARSRQGAAAQLRRCAPAAGTAADWNWSSSISPRSPACAPAPMSCCRLASLSILVIANAGVMACPKGTTADGFETQFGTNHLGHFVLVNRIASLLKSGSRLVNLSSAGHRFSDVDLDDPNFEHTPYTEFGAYGRSKTANILFAVEFDRRHKEEACAPPPCIPA